MTTTPTETPASTAAVDAPSSADSGPAFSWWEQLLLPARDLRAAGADPDERFQRYGHRHRLPPHWARTVGMWSLYERRDLIAASGLDPKCAKHINRFNAFTYANRLRTRRKAPARYFTSPTLTPQQLLAEAALQEMIDVHAGAPRPEALRAVGQTLGVLPVETSLYIDAVLDIMCEHYDDSTSAYLDDPDRGRHWVPITLPEAAFRLADELAL